jgi:hypothetical protein
MLPSSFFFLLMNRSYATSMMLLSATLLSFESSRGCQRNKICMNDIFYANHLNSYRLTNT